MTVNEKVDWKADGVEDLLRELVAKKLSASQIAPYFKTTRNAIIGKTRRLDLRLAGSKVMPPKPARPTPVVVKAKSKPKRPPAVKREIVSKTPQPPTFIEETAHVVVPGEPELAYLDQLQNKGCKYPVTRGAIGEWLMCNHKRESDTSPYCKRHGDICYNALPPKKKVRR